MTTHGHIPVLLDEVLDILDTARPGLYIDGTLGAAGHAFEILKKNPEASLVGLDRDETSLRAASERLESFADRIVLYNADFRQLPDLDIDFASVKGYLFDLGISSLQLDDPERGFSHSLEGPLDMRMDAREKTTAFKILDTSSESRLAEIFRNYGELSQARKLAREIAGRRKFRKFETTTQLRLLVEEVCRWHPQKGRIHPAAKVFQALRIEVNRELEGLSEFLDELFDLMAPGARVAVISFHSLEDRIAKRAFLAASSEDNAPPRLKLLTRKPMTPSEEEVSRNSRSRSAKMRAAERI